MNKLWKNVRVTVIVVFAITTLSTALSDVCANGKSCVFLNECSSIYARERNNIHGVKKLQCSPTEQKICCPNECVTNNNTDKNNLLPEWHTCGIHYVDRWTVGQASIDEHPWIALLRYEKPNGHGFYCDGVLISSRYVLTAAHCVDNIDYPKTWRLSHVRLGEWDITRETDCQFEDCSSPVLDVPIEETVVHEDYNATDYANDIAIIRLSKEVNFTDFIKPICLPIGCLLNQNSFQNFNLELAGWGAMYPKPTSNIKTKVIVQLVKHESCENVFWVYGHKITSKQICANGSFEHNYCQGDTGGILMMQALNVGNLMAVGVRSYGPHPCEASPFPRVYTRVTEYVDWIQSKMRP